MHPGRKTWAERGEEETRALGFTDQPYVVVVGGGKGSIALGARLRRLGMSAIIIERNARPVGSRRKRHRSLCLRAPKDNIGEWLEMYTKVMELNYWGNRAGTAQASMQLLSSPKSARWMWLLCDILLLASTGSQLVCVWRGVRVQGLINLC